MRVLTFIVLFAVLPLVQAMTIEEDAEGIAAAAEVSTKVAKAFRIFFGTSPTKALVAGPDRPPTCTPDFFSGSHGFCSPLRESYDQLTSLKSDEETHLNKILHTAEKCGDLSDDASGAAAVGAAGAVGTCVAGAFVGPVGWAACGSAAILGIGGTVGDSIVASEASGEQGNLNKLEQQCGKYAKDISKMADYVYKMYANNCITGYPTLLAAIPEGHDPHTSSRQHSSLLGKFTFDPAVTQKRKRARPFFYMSLMALLVPVGLALIHFCHARASRITIDRAALLETCTDR